MEKGRKHTQNQKNEWSDNWAKGIPGQSAKLGGTAKKNPHVEAKQCFLTVIPSRQTERES